MTDRTRAAELAGEIEEELSQLRERFSGREADHFSFGLKFSSWGVIAAALRAYAALPAPPEGPRAAGVRNATLEEAALLTERAAADNVAVSRGATIAPAIIDFMTAHAAAIRALKTDQPMGRAPAIFSDAPASEIGSRAAPPVAPEGLREAMAREIYSALDQQGCDPWDQAVARKSALGTEPTPMVKQALSSADAALAAIAAGGFVIAPREPNEFQFGDLVIKTGGSSWSGRVVGFYRTKLTPVGYCIESEYHPGSVQIYPEAALAAGEVKL